MAGAVDILKRQAELDRINNPTYNQNQGPTKGTDPKSYDDYMGTLQPAHLGSQSDTPSKEAN